MDKLNGDYIRGYTKALLDVKTFFENYSNNMKYNKLFNESGITALLDFIVNNREELREYGDISGIIIDKSGKRVKIIKKESGD